MGQFNIGDRVAVPSQGYTGEVVAVRDSDGARLVRYVVEGARRPFYETWWPASYLAAVS